MEFIIFILNLKTKNKRVQFESSTVHKDDLKIWHKRMDQISPNLIEDTYKSNGVKVLPRIPNKNFNCEDCKLNKYRCVSFRPTGHIR